MKSILLKTQRIAFLLFGCVLIFAQKSMKIPDNVSFYMEINGKQLNKKINWEKFNPFLQEIAKDNKQKNFWNDYSKTGIKYDATQYHYASFNDSVQTYTSHFIIDNKGKFQEFMTSIKKKGQEISRKNNYSYVDINENAFVAWNDDHAILSFVNYNKPYKETDWAEVAAIDSAATVIDSTAVVVEDTAIATADSTYLEKPFDYKEEIKYLKEDIQYLKQNIKNSNSEIAKLQKDIKYLEKNHQYPEEKIITDSVYSENEVEALPPPPAEDENPEYTEPLNNEPEMDSLRIENFKIVKKIAEDVFDRYFTSNMEIEVSKEMLSFRDPDSDVFVYTDYGKIFTDGLYQRMFRRYDFNPYFEKIYNSNSSYNLYFDKDKVKLVNNYKHKDPKIQKSFSELYQGKKNKKLAALINDKSIGYYVMNINGNKYFDMMYSLLENSGQAEYQKEMELIMETMKIVLDEEAIAKIAPGNGIFVLNELTSKEVEYTDYDYDDDYNEKEVKKKKEVMVPNFTFAFATENENYWRRVFDLLTTNKNAAKNFSKKGAFYVFKEEKSNGYLDQLFFTVQDGIVYLTTSTENITQKNQSELAGKWMKDSSKYPFSGRLNIQKLIIGLDKEFKSPSERKTLDVFRKNVGELYFKTEVKGESIQTEMDYNIKNSSENSLMYFFDLFDEFYKIMEAEKVPAIL